MTRKYIGSLFQIFRIKYSALTRKFRMNFTKFAEWSFGKRSNTPSHHSVFPNHKCQVIYPEFPSKSELHSAFLCTGKPSNFIPVVKKVCQLWLQKSWKFLFVWIIMKNKSFFRFLISEKYNKLKTEMYMAAQKRQTKKKNYSTENIVVKLITVEKKYNQMIFLKVVLFFQIIFITLIFTLLFMLHLFTSHNAWKLTSVC